MIILRLEVERFRHGEVRHETKELVFDDRSAAEARAEEISVFVAARLTQFLANGESVAIKSCKLLEMVDARTD